MENTLIIMMGLPRSGKTTQAREISARINAPIVNPDSVRMALHGHAFIPSAEQFVWAITHNMIESLFLAGHDVVVLDATNTTRRRRDEWKKYERAVFLVDTPVQVCLDRLAQQDSDEPHKERLSRVIRSMSDKWELPSPDEGFARVIRSVGDLHSWIKTSRNR